MLHNMLRAAAGRDRIPTDGLVAWYTMDNINGSTLVDEQGSYNGTITGATQTTGVIGQALSFTDTDAVGINSFGGVLGSTFTLSFWMDFFAQADKQIILLRDSGTGFTGFALRSANDGIGDTFDLVGRDVTGGSYSVFISGMSFGFSGFGHVTIEQDSSSGKKVYANDLLVGSSATTGIADLTSAELSDSKSSSTLLLDQMRFYNTLINSSERTALYNEGA